ADRREHDEQRGPHRPPQKIDQGGHASQLPAREVACGSLPISSTMKTSLTASPFSGPSRGPTVTSDSLLLCTSNTLANRCPAKTVSRHPRNSLVAGAVTPGPIGLARNEYMRPSRSGSPIAVTMPVNRRSDGSTMTLSCPTRSSLGG